MKNILKGVEYYDSKTTVSTQDIDEAFLRLKDIAKETPLQLDHYLSQKYDCKVYLKRRPSMGTFVQVKRCLQCNFSII